MQYLRAVPLEDIAKGLSSRRALARLARRARTTPLHALAPRTSHKAPKEAQMNREEKQGAAASPPAKTRLPLEVNEIL